MTEKHIPEELIHKYLKKNSSTIEQAMVESWHIHDLSKSTYLPSQENISIVNARMASMLTAHIYNHNKTQRTIRLWQRIALTATVLLMVSISIVTFLYPEKIIPSLASVQRKPTNHAILPGSYKAILTLYNGEKINLNKKGNKDLREIKQKNTNISIESEGRIVYHTMIKSKGAELLNTLETPRGGQYKLTLPDGTKVWLNAASILTYPTSFTGKERLVKLSGEAFFEVSKDTYRPFKVQSDNQTVEVLGTHFNISAYPEEHRIQTTLIEGKVKIQNDKITKLLRPGQESLINGRENGILISQADIEKNIAWKNNEFLFNGEDLRSIMRSIARWYDVEIVYLNYSDKTRYWGTVSRLKNISSVLKMLESTGKVRFKIEGRRIIAMN